MPSPQEQQRHRCGSSSARTSAAVGAPKARKLRATAVSALSRPPAERFMEAMWSDRCTYGGRGVMSALEFYVVDELFVADRGAPGGLDAAAWAASAADHKVAVVHRISSITAAGKAFCEGVGVGALLSRSMDPLEADDASPFPSALPQFFALPAEAVSDIEQQAELSAVDIQSCKDAPLVSELCFAHDLAGQSSCDLLLLWLRQALRSHMAENYVDALLDGAHVILEAAKEGSESFEEAVSDVAMILEDCAPECAYELPLRWHALQTVDTNLDRVAVAFLPMEALPALYGAAAQAAPVEVFGVADDCTVCTVLDGDSPHSSVSCDMKVGRTDSEDDEGGDDNDNNGDDWTVCTVSDGDSPHSSVSGDMKVGCTDSEDDEGGDDNDNNGDGNANRRPPGSSPSAEGIISPFHVAEPNVEHELAVRSLGNLSLIRLREGFASESLEESDIFEEVLDAS